MRKPLTYLQLAVKSLRFYRRTAFSVVLGSAVAAAVLTGGLLVGDCVTHSLRRFALMRLGETRVAVQSHGRFFNASLAQRLQEKSGVAVAPALVLHGVALMNDSSGEQVQVNRVQVVGVNPEFWKLAPDAPDALGPDAVALNRKLAEQLGALEGAEISIRVGKPGLMPKDAPLSSRSEKLTKRGSFTVGHVLTDQQLGRFSLAANQVAPYNVFVDIAWLQQAVDLDGRANILLAGTDAEGKDAAADGVSAALSDIWEIEDVGISLREAEGIVQLESDRIFLDPAAAKASLSIDHSVGVLAYLVNGIRKGDKSTPYSFAVAVGPSDDMSLGPVPSDMRDDQVIVNQWLSDQLEAGPGDTVAVSYYELKSGGGFVEREREFTVLRVAAMEEFAAERKLMPEFPGLSDVEQCREWDVGMPMKEEELNDEANQDYWDNYRSTPKFAVTLAAGREMWANRFGSTSAVRFRQPKEDLANTLNERLDPESLGMLVMPVREQALKAVSEAMSFGELFVSMSFFLIVAALMLTGMLFVFSIQQRAGEMGLLLSLGHRPAQVRMLFLIEGGLLALAGSVIGGLLGTGYTRLLIWGLARYWQGAVAHSVIEYHAEAGTVATGMLNTFICAVVVMTIAMWRQSKRPARELLTGDLTQDRPIKVSRAARARTLTLSIAAALAALSAAAFALKAGQQNIVYMFFAAGLLLLIAGLGFSRLLLQYFELKAAHRLTVSAVGMRNASRRGGRSLTAVALLACGCFLVFAVSAMQQDLSATAHQRWSGSGGFALFGEATLPVPDPLEEARAQKQFGLEREDALKGASFTSIKVRDGDDASCFNLNRAQSPRLLGVDGGAFAERAAFVPAGVEDGGAWSLLETELPDGVIAGLAGDMNTSMWNLQKKVGPEKGDEIVYRDERGELFHVKLVGALPMPLSVFQGTVLISKSDFMKRYPSEAGYRMFLIDVPEPVDAGDALQALSRRLDLVGLDVRSTLSRLEEFHGVEATYLNMFLVLGGLGVVLGTLGLGIVVLRNMLERRSELAILRCVGFSRRRILWLVLAEHWMLLALGLLCGMLSACVAVYPSLAAPGVQVPVMTMALLLAAIMIAGLGSTAVAVFLSLRGQLIPALRKE